MLTEFLLQRPTLSAFSAAEPTAAASRHAVQEPSASGFSPSAYKLDLSGSPDAEKAPDSRDASPDAEGRELSAEDERKLVELKKVDRNVRVHEQAHLSAAGGYARGGAQYEYVSGPDGGRYAVAGHVNMDTGREPSPEATLRKATTVRKAALAPADPSSADRQIAADMAKMAQEARAEISRNRQNESDAPVTSAENGRSERAAQEYEKAARASSSDVGGMLSLVA